MEPLSKEEIEEMESFTVSGVLIGYWPTMLPRLFYTARLGAEFERVCTKDGTGEKPLDSAGKQEER